MCLGVPGRVVAVDGLVAMVDFWGVERTVRLDVVDEPVAPGDYVLNHVGFAIRRIPETEIAETLALYEQLLRGGDEGDPMAADVRGRDRRRPAPPPRSVDDACSRETASPLQFRDPERGRAPRRRARRAGRARSAARRSR